MSAPGRHQATRPPVREASEYDKEIWLGAFLEEDCDLALAEKHLKLATAFRDLAEAFVEYQELLGQREYVWGRMSIVQAGAFFAAREALKIDGESVIPPEVLPLLKRNGRPEMVAEAGGVR